MHGYKGHNMSTENKTVTQGHSHEVYGDKLQYEYYHCRASLIPTLHLALTMVLAVQKSGESVVSFLTGAW